ncbi:MAG: GAF domain-containing protein [Planctomycetes bacterium]|nr:GAF domain-containing protein [Planctomycetota bacterium]
MKDPGSLLLSFRKPIIQALQDWFSITYKVGTGILDKNIRPLSFETNHHEFCKAVRRTPRGIHRCRDSDALLAQKCDEIKDVAWHVCDNGLLDLAAPIIVDNHICAYFFAGQLRGHFAGLKTDGSIKEITSIATQCGVRKNSKVNLETFKKTYNCIPIMSPRELASLDQAARRFASLLSWTITKTDEWDPHGDRLREYLQKAVEAKNVDQLLEISVKLLPHIMGGQYCSIFLVGKDVEYGERLILRKTSCERLKSMESTGFYTMGQGFTGWVWKRGRSLRLRNGQDEAELVAVDLEDPPMPSGHLRDSRTLKEFLCVPMFNKSKEVVGIIRTVTKSGGFTLEDELILTTLGEYLYSLLESCQSREKEADVRLALESALQFQGCVSESDVWATAVSSAMTFWGPEDKACLLNLIQHDSQKISVEKISGKLASKVLQKKLYDIRGSATGYVIHKREAILMHDLEKAEKNRRYLPVIEKGLSGIVGPICTQNSPVFAVLVIIGAKRYAFSEKDKELFAQLCQCAAGAIERIQERHKVAEYEKLLTVSNFLTGLQHDLCSPMETIDLYLRTHETPGKFELLSEFILTGLLAYRFLPALSAQERSLDLENSLRERVNLHMKNGFLLRPLIEKCVRVLDVCFCDKPECRINCFQEYTIKADYQLLMLVIYNLIKNARENAKSPSLLKQKIVVSVRRINGVTKIIVSDANKRIPKEICNSLFKFQNQANGNTGAGAGLPLAKLFIQAHPGTSKEGQGILSYKFTGGRNVFSILITG